MKLTLARLKEVLHYDPENGTFTRLLAVGRRRVPVGTTAGSFCRPLGYRLISIDGKHFYEHRLAWFYMTGAWPVGQIDHINTNKVDNRFCNLRQGSHALNKQNIRRAFRCNKTGFLGVTRNGSGFRALITVNGKQRNLGTFKTAELAHAAYLLAKRELHPGNTL